eukprot:Lankesteria_metandrocarpae@DN8448_c0_g1_i1.p1
MKVAVSEGDHYHASNAFSTAADLYTAGKYVEALRRLDIATNTQLKSAIKKTATEKVHETDSSVNVDQPSSSANNSEANDFDDLTELYTDIEALLDTRGESINKTWNPKSISAPERTLSAACWMQLGHFDKADECLHSAAPDELAYEAAASESTSVTQPTTAAFVRYARFASFSAEAAFAAGRSQRGVDILSDAAILTASTLSAAASMSSASEDLEIQAEYFLSFVQELLERHTSGDTDKLDILSNITQRLPQNLKWFHDMFAAPYEPPTNDKSQISVCTGITPISFWDSYASTLLIQVSENHLPGSLQNSIPANCSPNSVPVLNWPKLTCVPALASLSQLAYRTRGYCAALRISKVMLELWPTRTPLSTLIVLVQSSVFTGDLMAIISVLDYLSSGACTYLSFRSSRRQLHQALLYWTKGCCMLLSTELRCAQECFTRSTEVHPGFLLGQLYLAHTLSLSKKSAPAIRAYTVAATLAAYRSTSTTTTTTATTATGCVDGADDVGAEVWCNRLPP